MSASWTESPGHPIPTPSLAKPTFPDPENHHSHLHPWLALLHCHFDQQSVWNRKTALVSRNGTADHKQGCANIPAKPGQNCPVESFPSGPSRGQAAVRPQAGTVAGLPSGTPHSRKHLDPFYSCPELSTQVAHQTYSLTQLNHASFKRITNQSPFFVNFTVTVHQRQ